MCNLHSSRKEQEQSGDDAVAGTMADEEFKLFQHIDWLQLRSSKIAIPDYDLPIRVDAGQKFAMTVLICQTRTSPSLLPAFPAASPLRGPFLALVPASLARGQGILRSSTQRPRTRV
jgi:hypothetical protein